MPVADDTEEANTWPIGTTDYSSILNNVVADIFVSLGQLRIEYSAYQDEWD